MPLFIFPCGGRGDFLISILYGNCLSRNWNDSIIEYPVENFSVAKIHMFGPSEFAKVDVQPENLDQYQSFKIILDTEQDLLEISYFNALKQGGGDPMSLQLFKNRVLVTQAHVDQFKNYHFDYNISFAKLKNINYIHQLYREINHTDLGPVNIERIQCNININQEILKNNPFNLADIVG